jgi:SET family sugar efflux transporter-like MFS transporter
MGKTLSFMRQRLFLVLSVSLLLIGINTSFYMPYISMFGLQEVGMSPMALGVFLSVSTVGGIAASTIVGRISDKVQSRKRVLMCVAAAGMAGYAVFAFSRAYIVLLFAALFVISFSRSTFPQLFAFASGIDVHGREENRALVNGILRAIFAIGWVVGPTIGALVLEASGFTALYLTMAGMFAAILAVTGLFVKDRRTERAAPKGKPATMLSRKMVLSAAGFCTIYLATSLNGYALPLFVTETLGADRKQVGLLLGLAAAIEIPLMIFGGYLVRHIGTSRLVKIGFVSYVAYAVSVLVARDPLLLYPIQVLNALAISQIMGTGISYFQEMAPDRPGTTITLFNNTTAVGNVMGGMVFGAIISFFDYRSVYLFCALFAALAVLLLHLANARHAAKGRDASVEA